MAEGPVLLNVGRRRPKPVMRELCVMDRSLCTSAKVVEGAKVCVFYYCRTYYKGGKQGYSRARFRLNTDSTRNDDELQHPSTLLLDTKIPWPVKRSRGFTGEKRESVVYWYSI